MVIGEQKDIREVKNAYEAYEQIDKVNSYFVEDLKKIHGILTFLVEKDAEKFSNHGEAIYDRDIEIFMAPPPRLVPTLMDNLFNWMNKVKDTINQLILSSVFHYEFVFIHPFHNGNGRTARLWQTAILSHLEKAFTYLPIESMIKKNQNEYYKVIDNCNKAGNSTEFIEFMLKMIDDTIDEAIKINTPETTQEKNLNIIKKNPSITQTQIANVLGLTRDGVSYNIKQLKENGIITRVRATINGIWVIK